MRGLEFTPPEGQGGAAPALFAAPPFAVTALRWSFTARALLMSVQSDAIIAAVDERVSRPRCVLDGEGSVMQPRRPARRVGAPVPDAVRQAHKTTLRIIANGATALVARLRLLELGHRGTRWKISRPVSQYRRNRAREHDNNACLLSLPAHCILCLTSRPHRLLALSLPPAT